MAFVAFAAFALAAGPKIPSRWKIVASVSEDTRVMQSVSLDHTGRYAYITSVNHGSGFARYDFKARKWTGQWSVYERLSSRGPSYRLSRKDLRGSGFRPIEYPTIAFNGTSGLFVPAGGAGRGWILRPEVVTSKAASPREIDTFLGHPTLAVLDGRSALESFFELIDRMGSKPAKVACWQGFPGAPGAKSMGKIEIPSSATELRLAINGLDPRTKRGFWIFSAGALVRVTDLRSSKGKSFAEMSPSDQSERRRRPDLFARLADGSILLGARGADGIGAVRYTPGAYVFTPNKWSASRYPVTVLTASDDGRYVLLTESPFERLVLVRVD